MLLAHQIEKIISYGGGVEIDARKYLPHQVERFASYAAQSGAQLIVKNADAYLPYQLEKIAAYSNGKVVFKFE